MPDRAAATTSFRSGSIQVGAGLVFFGAANYAFLMVATRLLGPAQFADFNLFWGLVYGLGLGLFLPFEQETSRRTATAVADGRDPVPVARAGTRLALTAALILAVLTLPIARVLSSDSWAPLWLTTAMAMAGLAVAYTSRGVLSGTGRFPRYAAQLAVEGAVRLAMVGLIAVVALGVTLDASARSPWWFAGTISVALLVATAVTVPRSAYRLRAAEPGGGLPAGGVGFVGSLAFVVVSSVISQTLVNFGPVVVTLLSSPEEKPRAGAFLAAALVARMPLFAFAAVQAVLIPRLVRSVVARDRADFTRAFVMVLVPTTALGAAGVLLCWAAGPQIVRLVGGSGYSVPTADVVLLATAYGFFLVTTLLNLTALALGRLRGAATAWAVTAVAFTVVVGLMGDAEPTLRTGVALVACAVVAVGALASVIRRGVRDELTPR